MGLEAVLSIKPVLAFAVPLLAAGAILWFNRRDNLRDGVSLGAAVVMFLIIISMAPVVLGGGTVEITLFEILPGVDFAFRVDSLGMVFATVSSMLWIVAAIYCIGYMRSLKEHAQTRFFASFAVSLAAAVGGAFAANLFTLVIFYEALSLGHLSPGLPQGGRGILAWKPALHGLPGGRVEDLPAGRAGANLPGGGDPRFQAPPVCLTASTPRTCC